MAISTPIEPQADSQPIHADLGVLRFLTCGSVDDGKSTLIGRLLYDSKAILADALQAIERTSQKRGHAEVDLSLLTDGLQAEREQGITIDVAYRYFSTGKRSFIIADAPGHEQYTRNMVTAASTADLALILVDARKGVLTQTRRHLTLAHLVGIRHLVVVVNKMDLVGYDQAVFERIRADVLAFAQELGAEDLTFLPLSALAGDLVVDRGDNLPWYEGPTLVELLESAALEDGREELPFRLSVQWVIRPHQDFRGYAGRVASGRVKVGDALTVLPSGRHSRVKAIHLGERQLVEAIVGQSVTLELEDDLDISRGDLLADAAQPPISARSLDVDLCWLSEAPSRPGGRYLLRHGSRETRAILHGTAQRLDLNSLQRELETRLAMNDIAQLNLKLQQPLPVDPYRENRATGAFILVDETTHATVAAGFIRGAE
ncbi:sulfate adenylyltransferase subunit 1 [Geothrix sp. PMB-07]|uniref:sulfate adenylyltransferase subunit 1 n=1 Tax=Geothrix sp. PMB-07 TaxID=3068640 RepID=UPI002741062F|nr:GTP-binding protein [Geothrix sp. PMB-07]WLT31197.1 GTP-binding protein [Geothrix sp. PMB-07]